MSDKLVKCPFNSQHIMFQSSLQRHIIKCMVNYPHFVDCPYNAMHRFPNKDLLAEHMLKCDSKDKAYIFQESNIDFKREAYHQDKVREFNLKYENWDD